MKTGKKALGRQQNRLYFCRITWYTFPEGKGVRKIPLPFIFREVLLCMRNAACLESGRL